MNTDTVTISNKVSRDCLYVYTMDDIMAVHKACPSLLWEEMLSRRIKQKDSTVIKTRQVRRYELNYGFPSCVTYTVKANFYVIFLIDFLVEGKD